MVGDDETPLERITGDLMAILKAWAPDLELQAVPAEMSDKEPMVWLTVKPESMLTHQRFPERDLPGDGYTEFATQEKYHASQQARPDYIRHERSIGPLQNA